MHFAQQGDIYPDIKKAEAGRLRNDNNYIFELKKAQQNNLKKQQILQRPKFALPLEKDQNYEY